MKPEKTEGYLTLEQCETGKPVFPMECEIPIEKYYKHCAQLLAAAKEVIANWEQGDLAAAVRNLDLAIKAIEGQVPQESRDVFLLIIEVQNCRDYRACEDYDRAFDELYEFVSQYWHELPAGAGKLPSDKLDAIEIYFREKDGQESHKTVTHRTTAGRRKIVAFLIDQKAGAKIRGSNKGKVMNIEDTIFDDGIAINSLAALNWLIEVIHEYNTNTILDERVRNDPRVKRLFWFLNSQMYGQLTNIDQGAIWAELYREREKGEGGMRRIVVTMEGGLVTSVMSDSDGMEVLLVDYDTGDMPESELFTNPDGDKAKMHVETPELLPDRVEAFFQCLRTNEVT